MVIKCCFRGCTNESYPGCPYSLHRFPKDVTRRAKWVEIVRTSRHHPDWNPGKNSAICAKHFQDEHTIPPTNGAKLFRLTTTAVPMLEDSIKDEPTEERSEDEPDKFDPLQGSEPGSSEEMEDSNVDNQHHQPVFRYHCPTVTIPLSMGQKTKNRRNDNTDKEVKTKNRRNYNTDDEVKIKNRRIVNTDEERSIVNTDEEVLDNSKTTRNHKMSETIDHLNCVAIANKRLKRITYLRQVNLKLMKDNKELVDMVRRMNRKLVKYKKIILRDETIDTKDEIIKIDLEEIKIEENSIEAK